MRLTLSFISRIHWNIKKHASIDAMVVYEIVYTEIL